jgi:hypothetical protein
MRSELDIVTPRNLAFALLVAAAVYPGALLAAVLGQALGALVGGCGWIGITTPLDRQVWALVNQPTLHFASLARSVGYWTGSAVLPMLVAFTAIPLLPRARRLGSELVVLQAAWAAAVVGLAWLPLLDPVDGHLSRWVELWRLPPPVRWAVPLVALPAAVLPTLRLLSLVRMARQHCGRLLRLAAVGVHLVLPAAVWVGAATLIRGEPAWWSTAAVAAVAALALAVAWSGYPPAFVHRLEGLSGWSFVSGVTASALLIGLVLAAGRPVAADSRAGVLWSAPGATNNLRPWVDATSLPWVEATLGAEPTAADGGRL